MISPTGAIDKPRPEHNPVTGPVPSTRAVRQGRPRTGAGTGSNWGIPAALVALSLVPILAGSTRLVELSGGLALLPAPPTPHPCR